MQAREVSVNGFMVDPIFSEELVPNKKSVTSVTLMGSDLEKNEITEITDVELSFHIFDTNSWNGIVDTEKINLNF